MATQRGSVQLVKLILEPHWGLYDGDDSYIAAIEYAAHCNCRNLGLQERTERIEIINLLIARKALFNDKVLMQKIFGESSTWGCRKITEMMLEKDADSNVGSYNCKSALLCAAAHGYVELMDYLLEKGTRYLSIFFQLTSLKFKEQAANSEMMDHVAKRNAGIAIRTSRSPQG